MEIKDFVLNLLTINNDIGQIEYKINLDTTQMFEKCKHTPQGICDNWSFSRKQNVADY